MRAMRICLAGVLLLLADAARANAQIPITVGARSGQSKTVAGARSWDGGWSFDLLAAYRINPGISAYVMSGGTDIGAQKDDDTIDLSVYSTSVGMTMLLSPLAVGRPALWVGGGVGLYSLSATRDFDTLDEQSDTQVGFDVAAGVAMAVSPQLHIMPAIRFATFAADFSFQEPGVVPAETHSVGNVGYVTLDVGIMYNFGLPRRR